MAPALGSFRSGVAGEPESRNPQPVPCRRADRHRGRRQAAPHGRSRTRARRAMVSAVPGELARTAARCSGRTSLRARVPDRRSAGSAAITLGGRPRPAVLLLVLAERNEGRGVHRNHRGLGQLPERPDLPRHDEGRERSRSPRARHARRAGRGARVGRRPGPRPVPGRDRTRTGFLGAANSRYRSATDSRMKVWSRSLAQG